MYLTSFSNIHRTLFAVVSLLCLTQAAENLALGKQAYQSTTWKYVYPADDAVNGDYNDFSHTLQSGIRWWRVDLSTRQSIERITIFNRKDCCGERLAKITILTSTVDIPEEPSLISADWTNRDYRVKSYPLVANIDFKPAFLARHVAVYSENDAVKKDGSPNGALALAEVEVYDKVNLALDKPALQSSTYKNGDEYEASKAVNGFFSDFTHTNSTGEKWWRVDLGATYSVAQIKLFNRRNCCQERLANITILTSTADIPESPSPTSDDWTTREYRETAYPLVADLDFRPAFFACHVAVYSENNAVTEDGLADNALSLAEVEVYGPRNLAYNKPATQSDTIIDASNAIDGIYTNFSQTQADGIKWWMVDLQIKYSIGRVELYSTSGPYDSSAPLSILISNAELPENPSLSSDEWKVGSSQGGIIEFTSPTEGRHVAVFSESKTTPLALTEVAVYEFNYASSKVSSQSSTEDALNAAMAVDGDLATISRTLAAAGQWWKVDLTQKILLTSISVYVRNGWCSRIENDCITVLSAVSLLTNKERTDTPPYPNSDGWITCYQGCSSLGNSYVEKCSENEMPYTRLLAIKRRDKSVQLKEVEVYGHELAQLNEDVEWKKEDSTYASVTVSFLQWNQLMIGFKPPAFYVVEVVGTSISAFTSHEPTSTRVQVTLDGLKPAQEYRISVRCRLDDVEFCSGDANTFLASTAPCTFPSTPVLTYNVANVTHNQGQRWEYTFSWNDVEANCAGSVKYICSVQDILDFSTEDSFITFYTDGDETFELTVFAQNSAGLTSLPATEDGRSAELDGGSPNINDSPKVKELLPWIIMGASTGGLAVTVIVLAGLLVKKQRSAGNPTTQSTSARETTGCDITELSTGDEASCSSPTATYVNVAYGSEYENLGASTGTVSCHNEHFHQSPVTGDVYEVPITC